MTTLRIIVEHGRQPDPGIWEPTQEIVRPPVMFVMVSFELVDGMGRVSVRYIWNMEARQNYDDAEMRRTLLASTWWDFQVWADGKTDRNNISDVEVYDEHELLKWLCPGQDLRDLFTLQKPQKQINDKPLRLAAPGKGGR